MVYTGSNAAIPPGTMLLIAGRSPRSTLKAFHPLTGFRSLLQFPVDMSTALVAVDVDGTQDTVFIGWPGAYPMAYFLNGTQAWNAGPTTGEPPYLDMIAHDGRTLVSITGDALSRTHERLEARDVLTGRKLWEIKSVLIEKARDLTPAFNGSILVTLENKLMWAQNTDGPIPSPSMFPSPSPSGTPDDGDSGKAWMRVGIIVGASVAAIAIVIVAIWLRRRQLKRRRASRNPLLDDTFQQ